jgi:hypothetical protein
MIYKFECLSNDGGTMEVELLNEDAISDCAVISIRNSEDDKWRTIHLSKKNVYHLIGALHLLHKEMN